MRKIDPIVSLVPLLIGTLLGTTVAQEKPKQAPQKKEGYTDTPMIPGQKWRVHDANRPHPKVVKPGKASTQERAGTAPSDAVVLFDGKNLEAWKGRKGKAEWLVRDGFIQCKPRTGPITTKQKFGDCQLHIEWQSPPPKGKSQGRGNSGVFLMGKYEIQVLDSYKNPTYPDGQAGSIYGQTPPLVNATRKPTEWQIYDIIFKAPRFGDDGKLVAPAYVTVLHNGVLLHHHRAVLGATTHKRVASYQKHPPKGPIQLQDHGNPIRYRNIWIRELKGYDQK